MRYIFYILKKSLILYIYLLKIVNYLFKVSLCFIKNAHKIYEVLQKLLFIYNKNAKVENLVENRHVKHLSLCFPVIYKILTIIKF